MAFNQPVRFLFLAIVVALVFAIKPRFGYTEPESPTLVDSINLHTIGGGFQTPVGIASTGIAGDKRLFIVERTGRVWILENGQKSLNPFLDVGDQISLEGERGLLSMAFDPNFAENGYVYVNYTTNTASIYGDTVISRFTLSGTNGNVVNADSEEVILEVEQIRDSHNGGHLAFDIKGNLIIGFGDGGASGEETRVAQSRQSLLGKMVRINVSGEGLAPDQGCGRVRNYLIPADNPYPLGTNGWCSEILSSGWRNPWRFSLDPATGRMWVGDVGEQKFEEINVMPRTSNVPRTYGWPCFEGIEPWLENCEIADGMINTQPIEQYARLDDEGTFLGVSVTGGYVYQGETFSEFLNTYFFGDFISGNMWVIDTNDGGGNSALIHDSGRNISTFGIDSAGELYLADYRSGEILRVMGNHAATISMRAPGISLPDRFGTWGVEIKNIGAQPIAEIQVSAQIPEGVLWIDGGVFRERTVILTFEDIQPNETQIISWRGLLPKEPVVLTNPTYEIEYDNLDFVEVDSGIVNTTISNQKFTTYLPVVR